MRAFSNSCGMEALGQLAGSVAHDFNNLLSVIIGYSELLSANLGSEGAAGVRLQTIKKAGQRAASLTSQLLAFSRRQVLQPRVVNLNSLVTETERMLQRLMGEDIEQKVLLDPHAGENEGGPRTDRPGHYESGSKCARCHAQRWQTNDRNGQYQFQGLRNLFRSNGSGG